MATENGQKVICVTATRGGTGKADQIQATEEELEEIRTNELSKSLACLGDIEHEWLDYKDGHCEEVSISESCEKVRKLIDKYQPDTVITFGPEGLTGHSDHKAVARWASLGVDGTDIKLYRVVHTQTQMESYLQELDSKLNVFFNIDKPPTVNEEDADILLTLDAEHISMKIDALKAQASQYEKMFNQFDENFLKSAFSSEAFIQIQ